jgi:iron complex transport system ATP-binding protein
VLLRAGGTVAAEGKPDEIIRADVLSEVYGAAVEVFAHPRTGRPVVAPHIEGG